LWHIYTPPSQVCSCNISINGPINIPAYVLYVAAEAAAAAPAKKKKGGGAQTISSAHKVCILNIKFSTRVSYMCMVFSFQI